MDRRRPAIYGVLLALAIAGCEGPTGPQGPAGPQGPIGPIGPIGASVAYRVFEGAVADVAMSTPVVNTGGVFPGIVCYLRYDSLPGVWMQLNSDVYEGTSCDVVESGTTGFVGRTVVPFSYVNNGWTARIVLFWLP